MKTKALTNVGVLSQQRQVLGYALIVYEVFLIAAQFRNLLWRNACDAIATNREGHY